MTLIEPAGAESEPELRASPDSDALSEQYCPMTAFLPCRASLDRSYVPGWRAYYAVEFRRRAMPASIRRGARRAPQIIHRLRQPAMISALPAIMAS